MLVFGTANPTPYGDADYKVKRTPLSSDKRVPILTFLEQGLYLTETDLSEMVDSMAGVPVKIEHKGIDVVCALHVIWRKQLTLKTSSRF